MHSRGREIGVGTEWHLSMFVTHFLCRELCRQAAGGRKCRLLCRRFDEVCDKARDKVQTGGGLKRLNIQYPRAEAATLHCFNLAFVRLRKHSLTLQTPNPFEGN